MGRVRIDLGMGCYVVGAVMGQNELVKRWMVVEREVEGYMVGMELRATDSSRFI
jgi:hypothetical protein